MRPHYGCSDNWNLCNDPIFRVTTMTQIMDFCFRCPCEPKDHECMINNTILLPNGNYQCKLLRYLHNRGK